MRAATQPQNQRSALTPPSLLVAEATKAASPRTSSTPSAGTRVSTVASAMSEATKPASPKARIVSESEERRPRKDSPAVAWVSTQAGPATRIASRNAVQRSFPAMMRSRAAKVSCMLSEKLITMISGVMRLRNRLRRNPSHPKAPNAKTIAISGGAAATTMRERRRKNRMAIAQPSRRPTAL